MSIGSLPRIGLLAACVALSLGAGPAADKTTIRPFIALMHPGQVSAPQTVPGDGMTAFFQFDVKAHTLQFTLSGGDSTLSYAIRGPAGPGQQGVDVASGAWTLAPEIVGPLDKGQVRALKQGKLYILVLQPTAFPEATRAVRGQILPIPGVSYSVSGG